MISINAMQLPPPSNWQDFESLCQVLLGELIRDDEVEKNGRQGQAQNGVDVFGRKGNEWVGVQCKGKEANFGKEVSEKELGEEFEKAKTFEPKLTYFYLATTAPRDQKIQKVARELTNEGFFNRVTVWSWNHIQEKLARNAHLIPVLYSDLIKVAQDYASQIEPANVELPSNLGRLNIQNNWITPVEVQEVRDACVDFLSRVMKLTLQTRIVLYLTLRHSKASNVIGGEGQSRASERGSRSVRQS